MSRPHSLRAKEEQDCGLQRPGVLTLTCSTPAREHWNRISLLAMRVSIEWSSDQKGNSTVICRLAFTMERTGRATLLRAKTCHIKHSNESFQQIL